MQNIIAVIFKNESEGYQAIAELRQDPMTPQTSIMQMVLVKRENNSLISCEGFDAGMYEGENMLIGGILGSLMGILGGPIGVLLLGSYGALAGSTFDMGESLAEYALIEKVAEKMIEGEVALIILADEDDEAALDARLQKFDVEVARFDAAVVAEEVEEAAKLEVEMNRLARKELRDTKKAEFREKVEERRAKIREEFAQIKDDLSEPL